MGFVFASPSTHAQHPLPIFAIAGSDVRLPAATRSGRAAFAVSTTLTVCSALRLMPAPPPRHRLLCLAMVSRTSANHEVHFLSLICVLPSDTSRCCGELPGVLTPTDALEMPCPSEFSPSQQSPPHHCDGHSLSPLVPAPSLNLRTAGAFRKRPRASTSGRWAIEKSVAHLLPTVKKSCARCSLELLLKSSRTDHQANRSRPHQPQRTCLVRFGCPSNVSSPHLKEVDW